MHLIRRLKCTIVITRCPSSVVCPSICLSVVNLIFDFFSGPAEQNSKKPDTKQNLNVLYQVCVFRTDRKNKMAALASDWLRHFRLLLWNHWTEFNETWQEARSQRPLPSLCFLADRKTRRLPWHLIGWDIFDFSSETAERNSTKLDRKQDLNILYQVRVFGADRKKQDGRPGLWLAEIFSTSETAERNSNLTGSKISTSSTKFVFFRPMSKQKFPPCWSVKKVAHCTQVHDMCPFGPLVKIARIFPNKNVSILSLFTHLTMKAEKYID